jgi:CRISP-associated protein Cas1
MSSYAMLISQVHQAVVVAGFDPSIGIAHKKHTNPIPLVYDLMEPLRPVVDQQILESALSNTFKLGDFTINQLGACRLNPQMAKLVAKSVSKSEANRIVQDF